MNDKWADEEVAYLKQYWTTFTAIELGIVLNRTPNSVIGKADRLGLETKVGGPSARRRENTDRRISLEERGAQRKAKAEFRQEREKEREVKKLAQQATVSNVAQARTTRRERETRVAQAQRVRPPVPLPVDPTHGIIDIINELEAGQCRWPYGDVHSPKFRYCRHPIDQLLGKSYCTHHYGRSVRRNKHEET